jgi:hypothetical protein
MEDDFIRNLKATWQSQDHDASAVLERLRRNRWRPHLALTAEILGCACALLVGIWFAWTAAHTEQHRLLFALSAGVMLTVVPLLTFASVIARRASLAWEDETPQTMLRMGIRRFESTLQALRLWRWHFWSVAAFVGVLWVLEALGFVQARDFLIFYTAICFAVSLASWMWMKWRERVIRSELDACTRLLATIQFDSTHPE